MLGRIIFIIFIALLPCSQASAQLLEPEDTETSNVEELLTEAQSLLLKGQPIDARAKLLKAVQLNPDDYRPYFLLGQYYLLEISHFKLAYRHLKTADSKFTKEFGKDSKVDLSQQNKHAILLYMLSEAELNLDKYEESLKTLDRFEANYWMEFYPGTRAWLLMKLKRVDEAIAIAQKGIQRKADPRRTWNILGILLSLKGKRELSLEAFKEAIRAELMTGGGNYISTPLNNAGEVYREMFRDDLAEGSWLKAVQLPDGCDHILPSLNLANLYMDQLRLFQAERSLKDFEVCFREKSEKQDTEHRTLLALARGKIALLENRIDDSIDYLTTASQEQQWFGKIGTNQNDVTLASHIALSQSYSAQAAALKDKYSSSFTSSLKLKFSSYWYSIRAWWLMRQASKIALEQLDDFEDLFVRHTDSMLQYPTLGGMLAGMNSASTASRLDRMIDSDKRKGSDLYYKLYKASNISNLDSSIEALKSLQNRWGTIDRLAKAETLARLILAKEKARWFWEDKNYLSEIEALFQINPSFVRRYNLKLPVQISISSTNKEASKHLKKAASFLNSKRFHKTKNNSRYKLSLSSPEKDSLSIELLDTKNNRVMASYSQTYIETVKLDSLINTFILKAFSHKSDAPQNFVPRLPILQGIF